MIIIMLSDYISSFIAAKKSLRGLKHGLIPGKKMHKVLIILDNSR